jgi:hypothetical protein
MRPRKWGRLTGALAMLALTAGAPAQPSLAPLVRHTFEDGGSGWIALGGSGKVAVTHEGVHVKEGKAALQFDYRIGKGEFTSLMLPVADGALAKAKSFRFWVQTDHTTPLIVLLQEAEGGRYAAIFTVPAGQWQSVELSPADFLRGEDRDDPKDPNNRLDLDQVAGIGLIDLGQFFAQIEEAGLADLLGVKTGPHTLYVDDLVVSEAALPEASSLGSGELRLDAFARPQLSWLAVGGVRLSPMSGQSLERRGLQADYQQAPGKIAGFARRLTCGKLDGMDRLAFDVASAKPAQLIVQLEELGGGKYNTMVTVPGESTLRNVSLKFSEFTPADDSKDDNSRLNLDQVNQVLILDVTGFLGATRQENALRISNLRAVPAK